MFNDWFLPEGQKSHPLLKSSLWELQHWTVKNCCLLKMSLLGLYDEVNLSYFYVFTLLFCAPLCRQSAVVPASYGRWVEKFSWETKGTEEERQVGRNGRRRQLIRSVVLGLGAKPASSSKKGKKEGTQTFGMDGERPDVSQQMKLMSLCGSFKVRLKSGDGSLFLLFSPFTALRRRLRAALSGGCEVGLRFFGYFKGWRC